MSLAELRERVVACRMCPRLVEFREGVKPRASFVSQEYWRRPVPGLGPEGGKADRIPLVIVGLAPAAHGGNRTGRVFTGDKSGGFLFRALYSAGFTNRPASESADDGMRLFDCYMTAAVKCAPPHDKPTREEFAACSAYLGEELDMLVGARCILALGQMAFNSVLRYAKGKGADTRGARFGHGLRYEFPGLPVVYASYHPSPRNTNTGKLDEGMLMALLTKIRRREIVSGGTAN